MSNDIHDLNNEFLFKEIKGNRTMYLVLTVVFVACTVGAFIMAAASDKGNGALMKALVLGLPMAILAVDSFAVFRRYDKASKEIGNDPSGIDSSTLSPETRNLVGRSRRSKNELIQLVIAYGVLAIVMFGLGVLLLVLFTGGLEDADMLACVGVVFTAGGALLIMLTIRTFVQYRRASRLEEYYMASKQ